MTDKCVFCDVAQGKVPSKIIYQDELVTAFWDIKPIAPIHFLIVPNKHIHSLNEITPEDGPILAHIMFVARDLAKEHGVDEDGYRLITNIGKNGRQTVFHLHFHLIAGRRLLGRLAH